MVTKIAGADETVTTDGAKKSLVVSAEAARLFSASFWNTSAADKYLMFFDAAAVPADGSKPKLICLCPTKFAASMDFIDGRRFSTGIVVVVSTTEPTLTISATDDGLMDVNFRRGF